MTASAPNGRRDERPSATPMATNSCCNLRTISWDHKYVVLCVLCGTVSALVGSLIVLIYALIRSNTSSLQYFETIPTYIVAILLIINGLFVICFAKSKLRFSLLVKAIGGLYLCTALLSVVMTVTTTVLHMNRLQTHDQCIYAHKLGTCTCVYSPLTAGPNGETNVGHHMTFEGTVDCDVVHGILFSCLRGLFGLSVFAILICIFCLMLVYQLLSHQKKKKYLQQLELRRRFQIQTRGYAGVHPSAAHLSHVSSMILAQNRNNSLRHLPYNHSYSNDDHSPNGNGWCLPPPHTHDYSDSRSHHNSRHAIEDDMRSNVGIMTNRTNSWTNWLNWPRSQVWSSSNHVSNRSTNRGFFDLFRRSHNNNNNNNNNNREVNNRNQNVWRHPSGHNYLPPPHVFIPRIGSGGMSPLPHHLRYHRDNHLRPTIMRAMSSAHRRTRSNDGIFQHMNIHNMSVDPTFNSGPPVAANSSTNMFAIWGPPPPYTCSQPQSLNRINTICNNMNHTSGNQHCRQSSVQSSDVTPTSKMSTPLSERRLRCNAFSSQGIRLTIEANDELMTSPDSKSSCIVEIHVPYSEDEDKKNEFSDDFDEYRNGNKKSNLNYNTMPSAKRTDPSQPMNPFKSLSNLPIVFPMNSPKNSAFTDSELESNKSKLESIQHVYRSQVFGPKSLSNSSTPTSTTHNTSELTSDLNTFTNNSEESFSAASFPVDPPSDYKSTLIIQTPNTQSSPLTDDKSSHNVAQRHAINGGSNGKDMRLNSAQSMPNLSCIIAMSQSSKSTSTRTQPYLWELHRIPSSGNTSTSQDLADYELELDEESIKMVADLPNDNLKGAAMKVMTDMLGHLDPKSSSESTTTAPSLTPEILKPPTPFNNQQISDKTTTSSTATVSSISEPKAELIINIDGIQV